MIFRQPPCILPPNICTPNRQIMNLKQIMLSGSLLLLTACANNIATPSQWQAQRHEPNFDASGRLGVKIEEKGSYANFDWSRQNGVETIDINTPLGNTLGQLCRDADGVLALDSNGKRYTADTPAALSQQLLGYHLPIEHLAVWANGEWVRDAEHSFTADGKLQQLGWRISRELNENGTTKVLLLENKELTVRMVFTEMQHTEHNPTSPNRCAARSV